MRFGIPWILTEDMDEEEKAEAYEAVQELVERYNAGEITFDDLLEESDDVNSSTGEPNNDGYYTVQKDSSFVQSFKDWRWRRRRLRIRLKLLNRNTDIISCSVLRFLT